MMVSKGAGVECNLLCLPWPILISWQISDEALVSCLKGIELARKSSVDQRNEFFSHLDNHCQPYSIRQAVEAYQPPRRSQEEGGWGLAPQ